VNQGRCPNDPAACTLAAERALQPWAGPDSVCQECGSPLARIATGAPGPRAAVPPVQSHATPPPASMAEGPRRYPYRQAPPTSDPFASGADSQLSDEPEDPARGGNGVLTLSIIVLGVLVAGFLLFRALQPNEEAPGPGTVAQTDQDIAGAAVTPVSPPELRRLNMPVDALAAPAATAAVAGTLAAGIAVDVTGRVAADGARWARVVLPGAGGRTGFVREEALELLADSGTDMTLQPGLPPVAVPGAPGSPAIGPLPALQGQTGQVETVPETIYYVVSRRANIRAETSSASPRIGESVFGDTLPVTARRQVDGRFWYRVTLPDGREGWINGGLLSTDLPASPIDAMSSTAPPQAAPTSQPRPAPPPPPGAAAPAAMAQAPARRVVVVVTPEANVRAEPGLSGDVIDRVAAGDRLKVSASVTADGRIWLRVATPNAITGWISSNTVADDGQ
jgi:uncharacterized protein YgiM (DUF1202 family)